MLLVCIYTNAEVAWLGVSTHSMSEQHRKGFLNFWFVYRGGGGVSTHSMSNKIGRTFRVGLCICQYKDSTHRYFHSHCWSV